jgi:hypothetical protein
LPEKLFESSENFTLGSVKVKSELVELDEEIESDMLETTQQKLKKRNKEVKKKTNKKRIRKP